jgi:hypothetical protein
LVHSSTIVLPLKSLSLTVLPSLFTAVNAGAGAPTFGSACEGAVARSKMAAEEANIVVNVRLFIFCLQCGFRFA